MSKGKQYREAEDLWHAAMLDRVECARRAILGISNEQTIEAYREAVIQQENAERVMDEAGVSLSPFVQTVLGFMRLLEATAIHGPFASNFGHTSSQDAALITLHALDTESAQKSAQTALQGMSPLDRSQVAFELERIKVALSRVALGKTP
jgi:hypothetical protein